MYFRRFRVFDQHLDPAPPRFNVVHYSIFSITYIIVVLFCFCYYYFEFCNHCSSVIYIAPLQVKLNVNVYSVHYVPNLFEIARGHTRM